MLSQAEIQAAMKAKGWDFLPYGPSEWQWMKFDAAGIRIAVQCDPVWNADLKEIGVN